MTLHFNEKALDLLEAREEFDEDIPEHVAAEEWANNLRSVDDFFYDVFDGGYINASSVLDSESSEKVSEAIGIINQFREMYSEVVGDF